jgi:hypothetical protein
MPYVPVNIPFRGISVDSGFSSLPAGFTSDCVNVLPYDAYKGKLRIGQRRALLGAMKFDSGGGSPTPYEIQAILRADSYVSGVLTQRCIVVAGGEVFVIDNGTVNTKVARAGGISAMKSTGHIGAAVFGQYCYFADGTYYRKVDITQTAAQLGTAATGVLDWTHASGPYNNVASGSLPGKYATLLVRFGGRLAMAGIPNAPNLWFLSELNNPDHWNPHAASDTHQAVAGSNSQRFGRPGEPITALIPVGESGLLFAGKHNMNFLTADPVVTDARLIELSRTVGIVSERAWCTTDSQTIYVMAQDGLYLVRPNDFQVTKGGKLTAGRLDTFFQTQKFSQLNCVLGYDVESQNVYCFFSRIDLPGSSVHLVYNQPTDSFWPIKTGWSTFYAPTCCGEFPFNDVRAPILALGSASGYLGWFDRELTSGIDGQGATGYKSINLNPTVEQANAQRVVSRLTIGPALQPSLEQVMMQDVRVELSMDEAVEESTYSTVCTGPFLSMLAGQTAEEAIGENIVAVRLSADPDFPIVYLDGGSPDAFTADPPSTPTNPYDGGVYNDTYTQGVDLFYAPEIAPATYTTPDSLITDPLSRTYSYSTNRIYNTSAPSASDWFVQSTSVTPAENMFIRDETLADTSAETPGGRYTYSPASALALPTLPSGVSSPRLIASSGTYENTNSVLLGDLLPGRNDSFRCRIRDQAAYVRIESNGVPWAIERMAALIEPRTHNKRVKGTY